MKLKDLTKEKDFTIEPDNNGKYDLEHINASAMLRIADATETMAKNNLELERRAKGLEQDKQMYRSWWLKEQNKVRALKGVITKLKKKLA